MLGLIIFVHTAVCILLCIIILMQSGRGGGLTESFASAESIFGAKTNVFLVKTTTVLASLFLVTCLSLAFLSAKKDKSLMSDRRIPVTSPLSDNGTPVEGSGSNSVMDTKEAGENANQNTQPAPPVANSVDSAPVQ